MAAFNPTAPTTELEAVNTMLIAIGQPPLPPATNLATNTNADVVMALDTLLKVTREVLNAGWRFNTRLGIELRPLAVVPAPVWTSRDGNKQVTLNIFSITGKSFITWKMTKCVENGYLDMVETAPTTPVPGFPTHNILFDRTFNREGADAQRFPVVYLDAVLSMQFEQMPESARRYAALRAARQFTTQSVGSPELAQFTAEDEMAALRILKREQGVTEKLNLLHNSLDAWGWAGGRPMIGSGSNRQVFMGGTQ